MEGWKLSDLDFAVDVALLEPDEEKATAALARLRRAGEEVGLVVSAEKTKVMSIGETSACVKDGESTLDKVEKFNYLGSTVTPISFIDTALNIRIGKAANAFKILHNTWRAKISLRTKLRIYRAVVIPTLLYASETWATTKKHEQRLDAFDSRCLRIILKTKWWERRRNSDIRELTQQPYASTLLMRNRLRWFDHVIRMEGVRFPKRMYEWDPISVGGKRKQGRQRQRWRDTLTQNFGTTGLSQQEAESIAKDREMWRITIAALM